MDDAGGKVDDFKGQVRQKASGTGVQVEGLVAGTRFSLLPEER